MRAFLAVLLLVAFPAISGSAAPEPDSRARSWYIQDFSTEVRVLTTGQVVVTERIRVRFDGSFNGVYRDIPIEYRTRLNLNYTLRLDDFSVTDGAGSDQIGRASCRERV